MKAKPAAAPEITIRRQGSSYKGTYTTLSPIPGPGPSVVLTRSFVVRPVVGEMIDGEWIATEIKMTTTISSRVQGSSGQTQGKKSGRAVLV